MLLVIPLHIGLNIIQDNNPTNKIHQLIPRMKINEILNILVPDSIHPAHLQCYITLINLRRLLF